MADCIVGHVCCEIKGEDVTVCDIEDAVVDEGYFESHGGGWHVEG